MGDNFEFSNYADLPIKIYKKILANSSPELSQLFGLQEEASLFAECNRAAFCSSYLFRMRDRGRRIAKAIIDESGELNLKKVEGAIALMEREKVPYFPWGRSDSQFFELTLKNLKHILNNEAICRELHRFTAPLGHYYGEKLVRYDTGIPDGKNLSTVEIRRFVVATLFTPLYQDVGSCFATSLAILIQAEQPLSMLLDMHSLLYTGQLKKVYGGREYGVPLSPKTGPAFIDQPVTPKLMPHEKRAILVALESVEAVSKKLGAKEKEEWLQKQIDYFLLRIRRLSIAELLRKIVLDKMVLKEDALLQFSNRKRFGKVEQFYELEKKAVERCKSFTNHPLLKSWEYTLASLSESKLRFATWNLYHSLGFRVGDINGVRSLIDTFTGELFDEKEQSLQEVEHQLSVSMARLNTLSSRIKRSQNEEDARRIKGEYEARAYLHKQLVHEKKEAVKQLKLYRKLPNFLIEIFCEMFPEHFQEIYDPELRGEKEAEELYEDSPAGFRLLYKHGRTDPTMWTMIEGEEQFIQALIEFFLSTEREITQDLDESGVSASYATFVGRLINELRNESFMASAKERMEKMHQLEGEGGVRKPWAYTSGGTVDHLLHSYFKRESSFTRVALKPKDDFEVALFSLEEMRKMQPSLENALKEDPHRRMLTISSTHAFSVFPFSPPFYNGWREGGYLYTWLRDHVQAESERFYRAITVDQPLGEFLIRKLVHSLGLPFQAVSMIFSTVVFNRLSIAEFREHLLKKVQILGVNSTQLDHFLYSNFPSFYGYQTRELIQKITGLNEEQLQWLPENREHFISWDELLEVAAAVHAFAGRIHPPQQSSHQAVRGGGANLSVFPPLPMLFGDSNWSENSIAFLYSPFREKVELWRCDYALVGGAPLHSWRATLTGEKDEQWTLFFNPFEYTLHL